MTLIWFLPRILLTHSLQSRQCLVNQPEYHISQWGRLLRRQRTS